MTPWTQDDTFKKSMHLLSTQFRFRICRISNVHTQLMLDVDSNISFLLPTRKLEALQQSSDHLSPETFCMSSFFTQLKPNYSFMGLWIMVCNFVQNLAARLPGSLPLTRGCVLVFTVYLQTAQNYTSHIYKYLFSVHLQRSNSGFRFHEKMKNVCSILLQ